MAGHLNGLRLRAVLGRDEYSPPEPYPPDGWVLRHRRGDGSVVVSCADYGPSELAEAGPTGLALAAHLTRTGGGTLWIVHASMTRRDHVPSYDDLRRLHRAVWGDTGWSYQVFAPTHAHVNIHPHALHLWGRLGGEPLLPDLSAVFAALTGERTI